MTMNHATMATLETALPKLDWAHVKSATGVRQSEVNRWNAGPVDAEEDLTLPRADGWLGYANRLCGSPKRAALGDPHRIAT